MEDWQLEDTGNHVLMNHCSFPPAIHQLHHKTLKKEAQGLRGLQSEQQVLLQAHFSKENSEPLAKAHAWMFLMSREAWNAQPMSGIHIWYWCWALDSDSVWSPHTRGASITSRWLPTISIPVKDLKGESTWVASFQWLPFPLLPTRSFLFFTLGLSLSISPSAKASSTAHAWWFLNLHLQPVLSPKYMLVTLFFHCLPGNTCPLRDLLNPDRIFFTDENFPKASACRFIDNTSE